MTSREFEAACKGVNKALKELQSGEQEVVSDETCARAIIIVKNMKLGDVGDALLFAAALNVLNTYVKQTKENKKTVGYFFKNLADVLARYLMEDPRPEYRLEIQMDQGMNLLVAEINTIQFSFHQVPIRESDLKYMARDMENPALPWDGIRKQHNANTLFQFALRNQYGRTNQMLDGSSFREGMEALLSDFRRKEKSLSDLKHTFYGREREDREPDRPAENRVSVHSSESKNFPFRAKPSATFYESDFASFMEKVYSRELVDFLVHSYEEGYGYQVPALSLVEWKYMFEVLLGGLMLGGTDPETGIRIDYIRGKSQEMYVLVIASQDENRKTNLSLIELLSWEAMRLTGQQDVVEYRDNREEMMLPAIHPSAQLGSILMNFTKGIYDEANYDIRPCVFFYDAPRKPETDIVSGYYRKELLEYVPVFYAEEREKLWDYIRPSVCGKNGKKTLAKIRREFSCDVTATGLSQEQNYLIQLFFRNVSQYPKTLMVVDGRAMTGKSRLGDELLQVMDKKGGAGYRVTGKEEQERIPEGADLVIYDDYIPKSVDYERCPYHIIFFDPFSRTEQEKNGLLALRSDASNRGIPVIRQSLTMAFGFSDYGCGNNWLVRHFALGIIQHQDWNPEVYSITVLDSPEEFSHRDGIACVTVDRTFHLAEDGKGVEYSPENGPRLYKKFSKGKYGVELVIEDPGLKEKIRRELASSRNRYSWIEHFVNDYQGDTRRLEEAQAEVFANTTIRAKYEEYAVRHLGESAWEKLSEESRNWLLSALLSYNDMKNYDRMMDFSGVVVQISKTIETELCRRISIQYADWIHRKFGEESLEKLPEALVDVRHGKRREADSGKMTLGSLTYIMGLDQDGSVCNQKDADQFMEYAKEVLFSDLAADPMAGMAELAKIIQYVRVNYRNKAAHKMTMDMVAARSCIDYCIAAERKIGVMLDLFRE